MNDLEGIKLEVSDLKRRLDDLELRLETRISAAEQKELLDFTIAQEQIVKLATETGETKRGLANLASLQRAGHMAMLHLLGVTARAVRVSEEEISQAMKMANP